MTKKDVKPWQLVKFDFSDKKYVFPISPTLYDLLPKDSPLINRKYKTCSIVGSSGILLNSKCGAEIDTSDYVIRCNMAPRYGFTTDVGEKTNFMTMNPAILNDRYHLLISTDDRYRFLKDLVELGEAILWSPALTHTGSVTPLRVLVDFLTEHQDKLKLQFAVLGEGAMRYIKGFWKISHNFTEPRITTGLFMYTIAVPICDEIRLYGFYPFLNDTHNNIVPWHYYNPAADPSWLKTVHKMPEEYSILQKLHKQGALKLINRKCKG
uniref:Sia-alpha-2,3-Gal-beta-1,4-GlcNAc-R:alpha 2,8-sialyltransferase-like n=1 Tax=Saccoglossus kowalevskii TaxID=10224 RepID=A0ABM0MTT7_SACKO|nr:PREDICTED: sia-alpha-2,3-Gal-beta-1,4-GlcNAc-R:alpha 2,8-sialyltransferase-like [Saccoglossus kowalevskii]